ncbi:CLUMA_CG014318, isoform A [Clunio marinus]|uniref:CLUMA_CG014318, isoform A n=1 Tax=Clunio marinus TaxID=568069 RepID=A0A1J1IPB0_9DIPT|nr:CLUMA_CG014318, isoform A [Clunio marinus]
MFKQLVFFAIIGASLAHLIPIDYNFKVYHPIEYKKYDEPKSESWAPKESTGWEYKEAPANYDFKYEVHDEKTGDLKRQSETAKNGAVKGQYSLIDSDGFKRIVDYTADDIHGFQATVKREPTHYKIPIPAPKPEWSKPEAEKWW